VSETEKQICAPQLRTICTQTAQTPPRPLQCRPLVSDNISCKMPYLVMLRKVKK